MMVTITLVGQDAAVEGHEFVFLGESPECSSCKLRTVCGGRLEKGAKYRILRLRDVTHDCAVHKDGVRVVEIERIPRRVAMKEERFLIEGATVTFAPSDCRKFRCANYPVCHPIGLNGGSKVKILKIHEALDCLVEKKMRAVEIE